MSPMIAASLAWELAGNTGGRFRLGLGSQVRAHVERPYGVEFDPPGPHGEDWDGVIPTSVWWGSANLTRPSRDGHLEFATWTNDPS